MSSILTRRNFLKTAAAAGAASAAAPALAASSQSTAAPKHWDQTVEDVYKRQVKLRAECLCGPCET